MPTRTITRPRRRTGPPTTVRRDVRLGTALLALLFAALLLGPVPQASAANYRFWGYWQLTGGTWAFAQKGPDQLVPADGSVEGWRFAVDDGSSSRTPRVTVTFEQLCTSTPAKADTKRVGLVIDFGRDVDGEAGATPPPARATCVQVPIAATGSQVLAAATTVRTGQGFVCALAGYPAAGCGGAVATLTEAQKAPDTPITLPTATPSAVATATAATSAAATATAAAAGSGGTSVLVWVVLAMAFVIAAAGVARRRRPAGV